MKAISVDELQSRIAGGEDLFLLDVREADEREISVLHDQMHIPMGDVLVRMEEIPKDRVVIVYCRTGGRSGKVIEALEQAGFTQLFNLEGGINEYARKIDSSLQTY